MSLALNRRQISGPLAILIISFCLYAFGNVANQWFGYDRVLVEQHQYWRLITGNLLHTNLYHLLLNASGLLLLWALHGEYYRTLHYLALFTFCGVICTSGIYLFAEDLRWYVGLSGILHGLLVWGACQDIQHRLKSGWLLLLVVWIKIAYEQFVGPNAELAKLIEANIATDAHLFGACGGLLWVVLALLNSRQMVKS
ncbi:rhombosortase [Neptunicella sp. SCSIO 80796]|uniref:rhombosortase n=1 Tax=Neptunicella plasticusilytica TaxID=3117012 RepID=UPI003A4D935C